MCYGWEPDDIIQIISDLRESEESKSLEIIERALEKTAIQLGEKYRSEDYPHISLQNVVQRLFTEENAHGSRVIDTKDEIVMRTEKCRIFEVFKELNGTDIGYRYKCRQDYFMVKGYDRSIRLEIEKCLMRGDNCCLHHFIQTNSDAHDR
ncbi:MAG: L-2-amino-thiazoline-4-carboxylic acid hydrolase [Spirochaetales bacterium]|nr:L-2-amino-thiazoline-4-carboxylic acid hydrolase [Spirochaetales bacterium]